MFNEDDGPDENREPTMEENSHAPKHLDFLEIIYGVLVQPGDTFKYLASARPVLQALGFIAVVSLLNFAIGFSNIKSLAADLDLPVSISSLVAPLLLFGLLAAIAGWFLNTAALSLFAQLFGGIGNGPGLLAAFSFAMLPMLITGIFDFGVRLFGLGGFGGEMASLAGFVWVVVLQIIALIEVEQLSTRRAILVYFAVPLSIMVSVLVFVGFGLAFFVPLMGHLSSI